MNKILLAIVLLLSASFAFAQTESKRIAEQIAPLLNETVAAVAHVDLDKIDIDQIDAKLRPMLLGNIDRFDLVLSLDQRNAIPKNLDRDKDAYKKFLDDAKNVYGIRDIYILINPSYLPGSIGVYAIPILDPEIAEPLTTFLLSANLSPQEFNRYKSSFKVVDSFLIIPLPGFMAHDADSDAAVFRNFPVKPSLRPELEKALQAVDGSVAQFVVMPSAEMKRVFTETVETLPEPLEKVSPTVLTRGIDWAVLGVDADKLEVKLLVQSEQPQAAKDLYDALQTLLDSFLEKNKENAAYTAFLDASKLKHEEIVGIAKSFLPRPEGDRLEFVLNETVFKEKGKRLLDIPAVLIDVAQTQARRMQCMNNLKQIILSLHNHHDSQQKLPATYTVGQDGKPLHSWRVAVLPYLEQVELYEKIRRDEPWDSAYNKQFHDQCPSVFQCPEMAARNPEIKKNGLTTYSVIVGKNAWPDGNKKFDFSMLSDGTSNTLAVVERKTPVCWMDPTQEITQEEAEKGINKTDAGLAGPHAVGKRLGMNTGFFDGSAHFIRENVAPAILKALITRNGGESVGPEQVDKDE